jgi:hypothetical protein
MAAKKAPASLHQQLLAGLDVKSRQNGSVHTIKANGKVVAEVCVGTKKVRLNFRNELPAKERKLLSGKSKSWPGGGMIVTADNLKEARALLDLAIQPATNSAAPKVAA